MDKIREETARLNVREILLEKLKEFTLLSDVFLTVALRDRAACQHVLRLLTGKEDLTVKEVRTQYRISKILSHDAILDVLAEDEEKRLYNLEIQRRDTVDHCRRTRFYGAMIDSEYLEKGKEYQELADVYIFYISETDIRKAGRTVYPVRKYSESDDADYDDGLHVVYVNAEVDDGSDAAVLMRYFKTSDPEDQSQGALSDRVHFLKCEEGGMDIMCEVAERIEARGRQQGEKIGREQGEKIGGERKARITAQNLYQMGMSPEKIAQAVGEDIGMVRQWLSEIK